MGDGIEFLGEPGPEPDPGEERLDLGPRGGGPRWGIVVGALVVVAAVVAVLTTRRGTPGASATDAPTREVQIASPVPSGSGMQFLAPSAFASLAVPPDPALVPGSAVDLHHGHVQDLARVGGDLVALAPGYLARLTDRDGTLRVAASSTPGLPVGDPEYADWRLVTDGPHLWLVGLGQAHRVYRVDPVTLHLELGSVLPRTRLVLAAAALDGHLYLATGSAVYDLAPGATRPEPVPGLDGASALAADPSRHRLLLLGWHSGTGSGVRAYRPASGRISPMVPVGFGKGGLLVAAGRVWAGGFGTATGGGAVLERLDPHTLRPSAASPLAGQLGPGAVLAAAGDRVIWVRPGGGGGELWCVSATTGRAGQHWNLLVGPVVSRAGAAYVVDGSAVGRLRLNRACRG